MTALIFVDQGAIKGSSRSNPATYTGLLEPVRKAFAKANGVKPALFSANSEGACPTCKGNGVITTEFGFMQGVTTPCEDCGGRRFMAEVLEYTLGDRSIADVFDMPVDEARAFFTEGKAHRRFPRRRGSSTGWRTSVSAMSRSARRSQPCRAASASG